MRETVQIHRKLTGEELYILRSECKIDPNMTAKLVGISPNELARFECTNEGIPEDIYNKWVEVIKPLIY